MTLTSERAKDRGRKLTVAIVGTVALFDVVALGWLAGGLDAALFPPQPRIASIGCGEGRDREIGPFLGLLAYLGTVFSIGAAWILLTRRVNLRIRPLARMGIAFGLVGLIAYSPLIALKIGNPFRSDPDHLYIGQDRGF